MTKSQILIRGIETVVLKKKKKEMPITYGCTMEIAVDALKTILGQNFM